MSASVPEQRIASVRAFNRFYTDVIGVLREGLHDTAYSLTEARVLFELAQDDPTEVAELRERLHVDAGYLSRILSRFARDGLVRRERSPADGRRQVIRLTEAGAAAFATLDVSASQDVAALLAGLGEGDQRRLEEAMDTIRTVLQQGAPAGHCTLRPLRPGDLGWVVHRHGALYWQEYGWDEQFEALVARIVADYVDRGARERQNAWIAEVDDRPSGCVFCTRKDDVTAQLRLLLVEPSARGRGVGSRLVEECLRFARAAGYQRMALWTNDVLRDARRLYERAGFTLNREEAHRSFGRDLVGQHWSRPLT